MSILKIYLTLFQLLLLYIFYWNIKLNITIHLSKKITENKLFDRFVLTGKVTGGVLKTLAQADKESLQAKWISNLDDLSLRAMDIVHLVEKAR